MNNTKTQYPTITKYCSAIRHPQISFKNLDPILAVGQPVKIQNSQGISDLWSSSGGFASVFKYETFNPNKVWAVRCFRQSTSTVATHYSKVSSRLTNVPCSSYFVECNFLAQGIRVEGNVYPIVKMEWADGNDLRTFIKANLNNKNKLDLLAQAWIKLSKDLVDAGIAHGDLQHGNITVDDGNGINLKLIDYDSLYFSVDGNSINDEIKGILAYQHPLRAALSKQCLQIDFFPELVIYISIVAIAEQPQLWNIYNLDNTERLLFSKSDFKDPNNSSIFNYLSQLSPNIARLADELQKICKLTDFNKIPSLDTVLTPPVTKWNPAGSGTTSQPQPPQPRVWNPSGGTATNPSQNPPVTTWNPSGGTTINPSQNPPPQTWNPGDASTTNQFQSSQTSLTQQTQKGIYPVVVKTIAVISTVIATAIGGFCYYQHQQINQIKQQIEKIRLDKKLLPPKGNKPFLSVEIQNMMNVLKGKKSFLYKDIEQLVARIESQNSDLEREINNWESRVNKLEDQNGSLEEERDRLQSKVNEFEKKLI